jgi:hypothetical protein
MFINTSLTKKYSYHRVEEYTNKVVARFRCRKANPKKCNGEYGTDNYCQAYREAEEELNHREGKTAIDIGSLHAMSDAERLALLEVVAIAKQRGTPVTSLVWSIKEAKGGHYWTWPKRDELCRVFRRTPPCLEVEDVDLTINRSPSVYIPIV